MIPDSLVLANDTFLEGNTQISTAYYSVSLNSWSSRSHISGLAKRTTSNRSQAILGSMVSHQRVIVGWSQSAPAVGWGSPLHTWLASVNWIGCARYLNRGYRYGVRGMHYHILLRHYSQNYCTYNRVVKNTYSPRHKDACVQISIGNTEWLLRQKGVS